MAFVNAHDAERSLNSAPPAPTTSSVPRSSRSTSISTRTTTASTTSNASSTRPRRLSSRLCRYYEEHKLPDSPPMRVANPTVVLIPGLGMVTWGKNKSESRVTAEFYNAAVGVIRGAEAVSDYTAITKARGIRHRILAVGRSQAPAASARKRAFAADRGRLWGR